MASSAFKTYYYHVLIKYFESSQADDQYISAQGIFPSTFSPPPTDTILRIDMREPFSLIQFRECILHVFRSRDDILRTGTWRKLLKFFEEHDEKSCEYRGNQMKYEALLSFVNIQKDEAFKYGHQHGDTQKDDNSSTYFEKLLLKNVDALLDHVRIIDLICVQGGDASRAYKNFLLQPAIIKAFAQCLKMVDVGKTVSLTDIELRLRMMKIYGSTKVGYFRGLSLRDGILLVDADVDRIALRAFESDKYFLTQSERAALFTLCSHEATHHLARSFCNQYNFSSPFSGLSKFDAPRRDSIDKNKNMELGREMELKLFGTLQPDWAECGEVMADTFIKRAATENDLPLFSESEQARLVARKVQSVSFGLELIDIHEKENEIVPFLD